VLQGLHARVSKLDLKGTYQRHLLCVCINKKNYSYSELSVLGLQYVLVDSMIRIIQFCIEKNILR